MKAYRLLGCLLAASLLFSLPFGAGAQDKKKNPLVGIWQRVVKEEGNLRNGGIEYMYEFKVLRRDGSFYNMNMLSSGKTNIRDKGTYEIQSDSIYVERITGSALDMFKGRDSRMRYRLSPDGSMLYTEWYYDALKLWMPELWMKVIVPKEE
ncbi:MAG: DUF4488 domain-containing protein [Bacteroidaceae bacterium]|jgi:hypothetical protein